jgi:squalene-associated FAD-dependent desaturase
VLIRRLPLTLAPFGRRRAAVSFAAWRAPTPFHMVGGVLTARGLSWRERWALIAGYRNIEREDFHCPPSQSVAECFAATPSRAMNALWSPLCLAALNTQPERASAQIFANVLRGIFSGRAANSHFLVPATDLSSLFPDAAMRYIEARGGTAHIGAAVRSVASHGQDVVVDTNVSRERFASAIIAVGPHQLAAIVGGDGADATPWRNTLDEVAALAYESITTIYLAYAASIALPCALARLDDAPGQWVFDRSAALPPSRAGAAQTLLAVVISGNGSHDALDHAALAGSVDAQLRRLAPHLPKLLWSRVIAERRATYACTPALRRPAAGRIATGLYLAGDYTDADLPATLEAATRSGAAAAEALLADFRASGRA